MAASTELNALRDEANMFTRGLLDDQFQQLQLLQDGSTPDFIVEVITLFCKDGERFIGELAKLLDNSCVDFDKVDAFVHQLKGSSACVGAHRLKNTCIQFHVFCHEKSIDGCLKMLGVVRIDFYDLCNKFQTILQLEQKVHASNPKQ